MMVDHIFPGTLYARAYAVRRSRRGASTASLFFHMPRSLHMTLEMRYALLSTVAIVLFIGLLCSMILFRP